MGDKLADWKSKLTLRDGESLADGGWQGVLLKCGKAPTNWQESVECHSRYFEILRDEMRRRFPGREIDVIPAVPALAALKALVDSGRIPGMTDFFKEMFDDGIHMTAKERYFVALVHYSSFYKESPVGRVSKLNSGLTDEQAKVFQQVAWNSR